MSKKPRKNTWRHLVSSIKQSLSRSGTPSQSSRYTPYQVFDRALSTRAMLITRTKLQRLGIGDQCIQTIACVPMERADTELCPCSPPKGCIWMKSCDPLPKVLSLISVTNSTADYTAEFVEWARFKSVITGRAFNPKTKYYTFLDTGDGPHLYIFNEKYIKNVSVTGIFEDPTEAVAFEGCDKLSKEQQFLLCNPLDTNLYTDANIVDAIAKITFEYFAKTLQPSTIDITNDNQENAGGVVNPTV